MYKYIFSSLLVAIISLNCTSVCAQQIGLFRVDQMPDLPATYHMRDWKEVAMKYDSLIFDLTREGEHLPITSLGSAGVNYPEIQPILMDSYVGSASHGQQGEAINIIPAVIGATLVGADKTTQFGVDWVAKIKDFYNLKNQELVYLNGPSDKSGHDWWYETMPNIFFYQLYDLYPNTSGFEEQFQTVADRWLGAVKAMGADDAPWSVPFMNYRAWSLKDMSPLEDGVKEPEAAGAIAWILYQTYQHTSDKKYLVGAQWALDFLNDQTSNPSYELQLPYGVLTAAKLNAAFGAGYDVQKMLDWCFSQGDLRGWGSVVGTWGGEDISGLIGEANDQGNDYAFIMNGFQQAAALAPLVKYDKRFARSIGKWILNVSNASRLFYSAYLPAHQQSDYEWAHTWDPGSVIAYEAIKEQWDGVALYARGDAKAAGWAATNLGIYGSSHVGYLGALIEPTETEGILQIDVNATDFYGQKEFPSYLYFNPFSENKVVTLQLGESALDLYDAISETVIHSNVSGVQSLTIPAEGVLLISLLPGGTNLREEDGKLFTGASIVDYHYGYDFAPKLRIKSLASSAYLVEPGEPTQIYCTVEGGDPPNYQWFVNGEPTDEPASVLEVTPSELGEFSVKVIVSTESESVEDSLILQVVALIPEPPVIHSFTSERKWYRPDEEFLVEATVTDPNGLDLTYEWSVENGTVLQTDGATVQLKASDVGVMTITLTALNDEKATTAEHAVLVVGSQPAVDPMLQLGMNKTPMDLSTHQFPTQLTGGAFVDGPSAEALEALKLSGSAHELLVSHDDQLNFSGQIGIALWVYFTNFSEERFVISHGSWEKRWKLSTTVDKKLRWTVNTTAGVRDLDSSEEVEAGRWYYVCVAYDAHSLQLYLDGELDTFSGHSGQINPSDVGITIGKRLPGDSQYDLKGTVDEIRIYDQAIEPDQVKVLMTAWSPPLATGIKDLPFSIYPNPASNEVHIVFTGEQRIELFDLTGRRVKSVKKNSLEGTITLNVSDLPNGIYIVQSSNGEVAQKLSILK